MFEINFTYLILLSMIGLAATAFTAAFTKNRKAEFLASTILFGLVAYASAHLFINGNNLTVLSVFHIYPYSSFFILLFSITMMLVNLLCYGNCKDYPNLLILIIFSFLGSMLVAASTSVIMLFLGLELITVTTSFMILFEGKHRIEAAVKFFILGSISIAVFSFALVLLFPYNPQLALIPVSQTPNLSGTYLIILSIVLFAAAFGFDTALFPFNLWIPDVYEGAPTYITAMLAGINKKVAFVALIEVFFFVFFAYHATFSLILVILSVATMFFGNLLALVQKNVKRMFAYSSISQAGYIAIGIAAATQYGLEASIFYIVAHAFMIIGAFSIVLWLESKNIRTTEDYTALNSRSRFAAISLTILMLSMAGIPPLIGFAGKFLLFSSAISSGLVLLAVIGIINSFISIYYYGRLISLMYLKKEEKHIKLDMYVVVVVAVVLAAVILFGIYPQPLIEIASKVSATVFGMI